MEDRNMPPLNETFADLRCHNCDGDGTVLHVCDCDQCSIDDDECPQCRGTGFNDELVDLESYAAAIRHRPGDSTSWDWIAKDERRGRTFLSGRQVDVLDYLFDQDLADRLRGHVKPAPNQLTFSEAAP
jgi:hypothetical protein